MKLKLLALLLFSAVALSVRAETIVGLTSGNRLVSFDSAAPGTITKSVSVTGLASGTSLVAIDFRPATGGLYGLSSDSRIYSINDQTGVATAVGSAGAFTLSGTTFDIDFNPTVDRIRIISNTGQNLRVNPNDGTLTATDTSLAYNSTDANKGKTPAVVGAAYTNSFSTAQATTLYDIDYSQGALAIQNPPNAGTLNTVGLLQVDSSQISGFDISGVTGVAYAAFNVGGFTNLYAINVLTGAATTPAGATAPATIGGAGLNGEQVTDIAVPVKAGSRLFNIATRGNVGNGENVLIAGFITREGVSGRIVIRAIGPSLGKFGVTMPLQDPQLLLFDKNGTQIGSNDDFGSDAAQAAELSALGLAPTDSHESALVVQLPPDAYTAQVVGKNGGTGVALVEVYEFQ
ncbi:MAG: DUF4394 domain-containing protein [Verrucomicrobiota bacterium]|nr:DUF4394 domain-containing protein [Verrucomicrobiota bacterium]